ncbi:MAG: hypothetical protein LBQ03_03130 [Puniceicoccales bacterium]|jgi:acetyl esterase/lipase|nr:hypothetical protein [Puniceicoccales bacterium]
MKKHNISIYIIGLFSLFGQGYCSETESIFPEGETSSEEQSSFEQRWPEIAALEQRLEDITENQSESLRAVHSKAEAIRQALEPVKHCKDIEQAAQFSSMIENFQKTTDECCDSIIPVTKQLEDKLDNKINALTEVPERLNDNFNDDLSKMFELRNACVERRESVEKACIPTLFEPFLLTPEDPEIAFRMITTITDNTELPSVIYFPKKRAERQKLPCVVWLHGGNINCDLSDLDNTFHIESPNQIPLPERTKRFHANVSVGLQPLARFLASNGIVFATIEMDPKYGAGNIRQQIKDQVEEIKKLDFIDTNKMAFLGHSIGGYITSLFLAHDPEFLKDNFKLGIALVSPVVNDSWIGAFYLPQKNDSGQWNGPNFHPWNECTLNFALPNETVLNRETVNGETVGSIKENAEHRNVLRFVYPFSPTCGMSDAELSLKLQSLPPLFILMGTADSNTIPATQGGAFAWRLQKMGLTNWRILAYKGALHSPHRLCETLGNPPSVEGFKQMLSNVLQIARGNPPVGTQFLRTLSNGTTKVNVNSFSLSQESMRFFAQNACFIELEGNEMKFALFPETECGRAILGAMQANDGPEEPSSAEE